MLKRGRHTRLKSVGHNDRTTIQVVTRRQALRTSNLRGS